MEKKTEPTIQEMHDYLIAQGWKYETIPGPINFEVPRNYYKSPNDSEGSMGLGIYPAYAAAKYNADKKEREEAIRKGTATILCNKCGKDCSKWENYPEGEKGLFMGYYGLIDARMSGGYMSENDVICDCTSYSFSICEDCLADIFRSFKIPAEESRWF